MKHSATSVDHVSGTARARRSKDRTCELVFRESNSKVLRRGHMQDLVSEKGSCQGFPQQKRALSTRFPQILWIKLGKSGKVPKIRVKCESVSGSDAMRPEAACEQARTTPGRCFATETGNRRLDRFATRFTVRRDRSSEMARFQLETAIPCLDSAARLQANENPVSASSVSPATASQSWCCRAFHALTDSRSKGIVPRLRLYSRSEARLQ